MKVAVIHDWLVAYAGAECVLEQILQVFPQADLFSLIDFLPRGGRGFIQDKPVQTSFMQKLPLARSKYRHYLPLMPLAVEQFDLSGYDLVISSSHAVAKGVLTGPDQLHLCMCYTPIRYAWDLQHQYLQETGLHRGLRGLAARGMLHRIRLWDYRTANGVDKFIAISKFVAGRIWKIYRRKATVIYPPVDIDAFDLHEKKEDFYLAASRMVPYKRMDLIVEAFSGMPERKLVVIGDGPEYRRVKRRAGKNVLLLGYQSFEQLKSYMQRARAFIFAAEEDFGIIPVEAQACGTPVIAFRKGGVLETVRGLEHDRPTGLFFDRQTVLSLQEAVLEFEREESRFTGVACRAAAERFSVERFRREFNQFVEEQLAWWSRKQSY